MNYLNFEIESCKDCYSCLRNCPVKAIKFVNNKAEIISDRCILCGHCVNVCPQNAKKVVSDIDYVKNLIINNPHKVALSVAPTFISNFNVSSFETFKNACLKLGFSIVEETARGAHYVTKEYGKLLDSGKYKVLISTACPSAVTYIRQNYPSAIKYMAPIVSPMIAHGKILKEEHGEDLHVVFVGPCIAKKKEARESNIVDCALTFDEMLEWFKQEKIVFDNVLDVGSNHCDARLYPIHRGIIKSFGSSMNRKYDATSIDGAEDIKDILENIEELDLTFIEMNMCKGGCVNGPMKLSSHPTVADTAKIKKFARESKTSTDNSTVFNNSLDLSTEFTPIKNQYRAPSEEDIKKILNHIFKYRKEDEINCGACGYNTCREKAIAVFNGLADPEFCMPYLKNKAESLSNEIIQHTPNGIVTINKDGVFIDINERAFEYLQLDKTAIGHFYQDYIDLPELLVALDEGKNISSLVVYNEKNNMYFDVSITVVKEHGTAFAIYKDVTQETLNEEEMKTLRREMIEVTDKVINKQMAAVQEIASLLGESTAEAKIALVNFKNSLKDNEK